ncbi:ABC transporter permease [Nocardioides sp.]|uniref:ABC transporter permease n=1 Tax=Nocardioides sp. TaxID=35761 RepID=UPI003514D2E7
MLLLAAVVSVVAVALPFVYLVLRTTQAGWGEIGPLIWRERTGTLALNSVLLCVSVSLGSLLLGVPTGWLISRTRLPGLGWWRVLAALPLAVPSYVGAYAWLSLVPGLDGYLGATLVLTLVSTPYVTLPVAAALRRADTDVEDVARTLGRSPVVAAWSTLMPQAAPAAGAGALLAALYTLSDFGAPALMRYEVFTLGIRNAYRVGFDRTLAAVLALLLAALALVVVLVERACRGGAQRRQAAAAGARPAPPRELGRGRLPAMVFLGVVGAAGVGVPAVALLVQMGASLSAGVVWDDLIAATGATLVLSVAGGLLTLVLALPIGALAARYRGRTVAVVESASYLGNALPGIVVGLALVFMTVTLVPALYQTAFALAAAYAVMFLPKAVGAVRAALGQVPREVEDVARTLGRGPVRVWVGVTARIASPGVLAGLLLVVVTAMKELPATLLLRPLGVDTLATELWTATGVGAYGQAAPYAVALILLAAGPAYLLSRPERDAGDRE